MTETVKWFRLGSTGWVEQCTVEQHEDFVNSFPHDERLTSWRVSLDKIVAAGWFITLEMDTVDAAWTTSEHGNKAITFMFQEMDSSDPRRWKVWKTRFDNYDEAKKFMNDVIEVMQKPKARNHKTIKALLLGDCERRTV